MNIKWKNLLKFENIALLVYIATGISFLILILNRTNDTLAMIFGVLTLISLAITIFSPLFKEKRISNVGWLIIAFDCVTAIVLFCTFLCTLPNDNNMRDVFTAVGSASVGGFFTVYGVGLGVKCNRLDRKEEEMLKLKPRAMISGTPKEDPNYSFFQVKVELFEGLKMKKTKNSKAYKFETLVLANSDFSECSFEGIVVNKTLVMFNIEHVISKNSFTTFEFAFDYFTSEKIETVQFMFRDLLDNLYLEKVRFKIDSDVKKDENKISFISSFGSKYYMKAKDFFTNE